MRAMDQAVGLGLLAAEAEIQSPVSPCEICSRQSAAGKSFYQSTSVFPGNIIQPILHTHLYLHVALTRRTSGRGLGTFQKAMLFQNSRSIEEKSTFTFYAL
jgi:hypothetical protein